MPALQRAQLVATAKLAARLLRRVCVEGPAPPSAAGLLQALATCVYNAHACGEDTDGEVGVGAGGGPGRGGDTGLAIYARASLANHACRPSALATFRGHRIRLIARRHLHMGSHVTLDYIAGGPSGQSRRQALRDRWGFNCACPACQGEEAIE